MVSSFSFFDTQTYRPFWAQYTHTHTHVLLVQLYYSLRNDLSEVPEAIPKLVNLIGLNLQVILLSMDRNIARKYFLRVPCLDQKGNRLHSLPSTFTNLTNLQHLCLCNNNLVDIECLCYLSNLRELKLSHNNITYLPTQIGYLTKLKVIIEFEGEKLMWGWCEVIVFSVGSFTNM